MSGKRRKLGAMLAAAWAALFFVGASFRVLADCASFGLPFTDLGSTSFCAAIAEAYYTGLTHGTSATTFSPTAPVNREQAAIFATRTLDAALARGSRRAALGQWWTTTPHGDSGLGLTIVGVGPQFVRSDGADLWISNHGDSTVSRVRASDGRLLETWTDADGALAILVAMGRVFVSGGTNLYMIDPSQTAGPVVSEATLGGAAYGLAFDGNRIWSANYAHGVTLVTPGTWETSTVTDGFNIPFGIVYDGRSMWVTDIGDNVIRRVDPSGAIIQNVNVGKSPAIPAFDGANLWVPNQTDNSVSVIRASDGAVLATLTGNGLNDPVEAAFDGRRIAVTNNKGGVSVFDASTLEPRGSIGAPAASEPVGVCSDGIDFWVTLSQSAAIGRF